MAEPQGQYKDRLFSFIFGSGEHKEWTLSLYNAVGGTHYDDPEQIVITTIREALYLGMHNDVSFLICNQMNMYEQQSTFNPNMPLRMLQYAGSLYEKDITLRGKNKYSRRIVPLPVPRLVVFYNGLEQEADVTELRLSDAFPQAQRAAADIEVRVRMLNINYGHNQALMAACKPLTEYAWIVDRIRTLEKTCGLEAAIGIAIDEMPSDFQVKPLLEGHRAEVKTMLLTEYNETRQMELVYNEGREEGRQEGREEGRQEGRKEGRQEGRKEGISLLSKLFRALSDAGRLDDILRAASDPAYRDRLMDEMHLT